MFDAGFQVHAHDERTWYANKLILCLSQTSKTLNYLDSPIVGPYYALFMGVWIYMRHYLNLKVIYSLFTEFKTVGPYELDWAGGQFKCEMAFWITLILLSSLQALNVFWLYYIIRIAYRFVRDKHATDERSDDEGEDDDEEPIAEASSPKNSS